MQRPERGFSLIEILISAMLIAVAAMAGVAYVTRGAQHADWSRDRVFARQKALNVLAELRAYVEGGEGEVAADLDGFDDGLATEPALTIQPDPNDPGAFLPPDHPTSGNVMDRGQWRWQRRISVRRFPGVDTRDLRVCTVTVFRMRPGDVFPGEEMAEVSTVIRTIGDAFPTTQVYDVYLLAVDNVPGWWVYMDAIQSFIEATLTDLESRNPGLELRAHWVTKLGFGRDEEYAPYTNETRESTDDTPWAYVYPGRMPAGEAASRYYVGARFGARMNLDGETTPSFVNTATPTEPYTDTNGNGERDPGEPYTDWNGNGMWDLGNPVPYALADMHNHCMRWPDAVARFDARVGAGLDEEETPTWRLLLDRMVAEPERYHNAILINLHGELLPMPPVRNYSDAAKIPVLRPGWRAVTHPEMLSPRRVAGDDVASDTPRFRLYAYKTEFVNDEVLTTQREPFTDTDGNGAYDAGETYADWNGNGQWDAGLPITVAIPGGDFTARPNQALNPTLLVRRLPGGIDGDGDGNPDDYRAFHNAPRYPEAFNDTNSDDIRQIAEPFLDLDGNGTRDGNDVHQELDGDGTHTPASELLTDANGNGRYDPATPAEEFTDTNGNDRWDAAEPYWDADSSGDRTPPSSPVVPWRPWDPAIDDKTPVTRSSYITSYGEPFLDLDGDDAWDPAEPFTDRNLNGVCDGGFERGEMWFEVAYDGAADRTVLTLHGTPLETPYVDNATNSSLGLLATRRLYDLDYIPCPTPNTSSAANRFGRDLAWSSGTEYKNTARWTIELPLPAVRSEIGDTQDTILAVETRFGANLDTGTMWPTRNAPQNLSRGYAYFYADPADVPFSERYQFLGDPRHCPYADLDRTGTTSPHGYNWYFDDFQDGSYNYQSRWLALDASRMRNAWMGARGSGHDVPRLFSWLRTAIAKTEAVYTTLTGFSYYYMSVGGDVGYDTANGFPNSIPMDGAPFGQTGDVNENTITDGGGTSSIIGSLKYVRSNDGDTGGIRYGGYWWSKPWIGELFQDSAYATQWATWGNLRANSGTGANEYHLVRRGDVTRNQQPRGTTLVNAYARTAAEGCVSVFNIGSSGSTFHHQFQDGRTGTLTEDGPQLATNYNFPTPTTTAISRPFGLGTSANGGVGDEFGYTASYPRFRAQMVTRFYDHTNGQTGSGLVRLQEPGANPRGGYVVVNGIDRTLESGSAFIARYSLLTLLHSFFAAGLPGSDNRITQLPRLQVLNPTLVTELEDPAQIQLRWSTEWTRWDGLSYTESYASNFAEDESQLVYVPMYSKDNGGTWLHMKDDSPATPGAMPWIDGAGPDPDKTVTDAVDGGDESWTWNTPAGQFPEGSYLIRIEGYRTGETLHYVQHMEKIYVNR